MTDPSNHEQTRMEQIDKETPANEAKEQIQVRLGQRLCSARKRRGLTVREASAQLKIREVYLRALEGGDWNHLPEEVYVLAFLRQYAALLGEDCHEDIEALKSGDYQLTKPYTIPDPPIAPNKMWAIAAAILFILLFILFNTLENGKNETLSSKTSIADTSPPPPDRTTTTKHLTPKDTVKENAPLAPPLASQLPAAASDSSPPSPKINPTTMPQTKKVLPLAAITKKVARIHRYRLTAIGSSAWLQVRDSSGILLKEVLLHPRQSVSLESDAPFLMVTCGDAAALKIEVDHTLYAAAGTLGAAGEVLRGFRINASGQDLGNTHRSR